MSIQPNNFREAFNVHKEIGELEQRLQEKKRELAEKKESEKYDKELIKESIKEKTQFSEITTTPPAKPFAAPKVIIKKAKQIKGEKKEKQIKLLTDLAFERGIIHATEVANKLDDPYILDEFHDTLVDELYKHLVEQGKLKKV